MILTDRDRKLDYDGLSQVITDEKALNNLLSNFAIREIDEPATKLYIDARISEVQIDVGALRKELAETEARLLLHMSQEVNGLRSELKGDIADLRTELKGDIAELSTELKGDIAELSTELKGDIAELSTELKGDIAELRKEMRTLTHKMYGGVIAVCVAIIGSQAFF